MNSILADNDSWQHPSVFQTPQRDLELDRDPSLLQTTDPASLWLDPSRKSKNTSFHESITLDPSDPPMTMEQRDALIEQLDPVIDAPMHHRTAPCLLFYTFFSQANILLLQNECRFKVRQASGYNAAAPQAMELMQIMDFAYEHYAREIDESRAGAKRLAAFIRQQIMRLNAIVCDRVVRMMVDEIVGHVGFLKQMANPRPNEALMRPENTKMTGLYQYRAPSDIYS